MQSILDVGPMSIDINFEPDLTRFFARPKTEFIAVDEAGEFTRFLGLTNPRPITHDGTMDVSVTDIEVLECGNVYDRQGSD